MQLSGLIFRKMSVLDERMEEDLIQNVPKNSTMSLIDDHQVIKHHYARDFSHSAKIIIMFQYCLTDLLHLIKLRQV